MAKWSQENFSLSNQRPFNINATSSCFAVQVTNVIAGIRLMLETSTGIVTDRTWKCVQPLQPFTNTAWTRKNFNDSSWPNAVEIGTNSGLYASKKFAPDRQWISVARDTTPRDQLMYCRKVV
jgi:hypothetical protein